MFLPLPFPFNVPSVGWLDELKQSLDQCPFFSTFLVLGFVDVLLLPFFSTFLVLGFVDVLLLPFFSTFLVLGFIDVLLLLQLALGLRLSHN